MDENKIHEISCTSFGAPEINNDWKKHSRPWKCLQYFVTISPKQYSQLYI